VPRNPRTIFEVQSESLRTLAADWRVPFPSIPVVGPHLAPNVTRSFRRTESYEVEAHVRRLKQHHCESVASLRFVHATVEALASLTLDYRITSASLPDQIMGQLHLIVR
jgi:hypothetical protein